LDISGLSLRRTGTLRQLAESLPDLQQIAFRQAPHLTDKALVSLFMDCGARIKSVFFIYFNLFLFKCFFPIYLGHFNFLFFLNISKI
jgi:hypothetical protein